MTATENNPEYFFPGKTTNAKTVRISPTKNDEVDQAADNVYISICHL